MALRMDWDFSPTLFKALYGLERNAQQLGHLHLSFSQEMSNVGKFFFVHVQRLPATVPQCDPIRLNLLVKESAAMIFAMHARPA